MTTNLTSEDKDKEISEIKKNRSESALNWFSIINMVALLVIAGLNISIDRNLNDVNQKLEDAEFLETTIDHLAGNTENREIALSILYSLYNLEDHKHKDMLIDVSDTILETNLISQKQETYISVKALKILEKLDLDKWKEWNIKLRKHRQDSNPDTTKEPSETDRYALQKNNTFVSTLLNSSDQAKDKNGLVFIQYNDQSKESSIDVFRKELSEKWNAPGIEFIENYTAPPEKLGDIRYFHGNEKELAQELQKILNNKYCPQKECFGEPINLEGKYKNLPEKQFEIWIDAKEIK